MSRTARSPAKRWPRHTGCRCHKFMSPKSHQITGRFFSPKILSAAFLFLILGAGGVLAQRPLGCDVSGYQPGVNWTQVKNAGVTFCWSKATESTSYVNPYFTAQQAGAKNAGIYVGAYHFARPSSHPNITGANSADTEANYFWSVASN